MNILVLCTGNSARSILLEAILNDRAAGRVTAYSAGSDPTGAIEPQALALLAENDIDTRDLRSKSWEEFADDDAPEMDLVLTLCSDAAAQTCPVWPGAPVRAHWAIPDPTPGDDAAFAAAYATLDRRASALLKHGIEIMDAGELKATLNRIAKQP
ncbi:arsenate reductase ArsC [Pseudooceanicola nanhaiensis]|uniref:arsenate reductase ArsC n=1 Tax=Pseudooceanicola nanhaiensis TaxID=375761 RepID=UPI001CD544FF|nr:arsenate reductase ArsC [Pseudooceanicola nanhaiensis]MCA0920751.1 arsenate reductase ArsC [Pseudooceanicola nanhaiensis]